MNSLIYMMKYLQLKGEHTDSAKFTEMVSNSINISPDEQIKTSDYEHTTNVNNWPLHYGPIKADEVNVYKLNNEERDQNVNVHKVKRSVSQIINKENNHQVKRTRSEASKGSVLQNGIVIESDTTTRPMTDSERDRVEGRISNNKSEVGFMMEDWIAINMLCPYCKQKTLRTYHRKNIPTVDLICINPEHDVTIDPIFFQVKTSSNNSYFSRKNRTLHIGSIKRARPVLETKPDDDKIKKNLLTAYICVIYKQIKIGYEIDKENSFVILPQTVARSVSSLDLVSNTRREKDDFYFKVIDKDKGLVMFSNDHNITENLVAYIENDIMPYNFSPVWISVANPRANLTIEDK